MATPIEGISAFFNLSASSFLTVDPNALINNSNQGFIRSTRFSSDTITLSSTARAFLAIQSQNFTSADRIANLIQINLAGQNFTGTDLTGAVLNFSNLRNANFSNATLRNVSFANADLTGARFFNADLRGANFAGASGLTAEQLLGARVDSSTTFPIGVKLI